jgi:hypothetical protein
MRLVYDRIDIDPKNLDQGLSNCVMHCSLSRPPAHLCRDNMFSRFHLLALSQIICIFVADIVLQTHFVPTTYSRTSCHLSSTLQEI